MSLKSGAAASGAPEGMQGWIRGVEELFLDLGRRMERVEQGVENGRSSITSTFDAISSVRATSTRSDGGALVAGANTVVSAVISVPQGKTRATLLAIGNAAYLDRQTGGVTSLNGNIVLGGSTGPTVPSSKDAGASMVNNILNMGHTVAIADLTQPTVEAFMQVTPLSSTAFSTPTASNFATLTFIAIFDN